MGAIAWGSRAYQTAVVIRVHFYLKSLEGNICLWSKNTTALRFEQIQRKPTRNLQIGK